MDYNALELLAQKYGTDKQVSCHNYTTPYFKHFNPIKDRPMRVLEIGVHKGYSLNMWADFFPNSQIWGIDDGSSGDLCETYENPRIHFRKGHQTDNVFLDTLVADGGFDLIFDDGSHYSSDIVKTFQKLWPFINPHGYYVIEDLQCSFPPYNAPGLSHRFNAENLTAVQYIGNVVDALHNKQTGNILGIYTYPEITFIEAK